MGSRLEESVRSTTLSTIKEEFEETKQDRIIARFRAAQKNNRKYDVSEIISSINRVQAEEILKKNHLGAFLVRPCTQEGCIAISVNNGMINHGLLKQIGELYQMVATREDFEQDGYYEDEIDDFLRPYPLPVFLEFYRLGAATLESGTFVKV